MVILSIHRSWPGTDSSPEEQWYSSNWNPNWYWNGWFQ